MQQLHFNQPYQEDNLHILKKPTLLIISSTYPISTNDPSPRFVHELASRLRSNFRVYVLAPSIPTGRSISRIDGVVILRHRYFFKRFELLAQRDGMLENLRQKRLLFLLLPFYAISQLYYLVLMNRRLRPDVINAHWLYPQGLIATIAKFLRLAKAPLLCTVHGGDLYSLPRLNPVKRFVINRAESISVVGKHMSNQILHSLHAQPHRLQWRSMGADLTVRFTPSEHIISQKDFIFVGRMAEKKGVPVLLQGMKILIDRGLNCNLTLVGGGERLPTIKMLAHNLSISDKLTFHGRIPHSQLPALLREHRYFIFPSLISKSGDQEGMPLSPIEAQGCGCVVIASELVSTPEFVINGKTGYTFPAGDALALADVMQQALVDSQEHYSTLQQSGRAYALKNYDWSAVCSFYTQELNLLISENK